MYKTISSNIITSNINVQINLEPEDINSDDDVK